MGHLRLGAVALVAWSTDRVAAACVLGRFLREMWDYPEEMPESGENDVGW
jgi:hypothetical protein